MMSLLLYLAVLVVSLSSVLFGLGWLSAPEPHYAAPPALVAAQAPAPKPHVTLSPVRAAAPSAPAAVTPKHAVATAPAAPAAVPVAQTVATTKAAAAPEPAASTDQANAAPPSAEAAAPPPPLCDIAACERAYFTFNASDCTYQPSHGDRRLCTKGTPPQKSTSVENARAQASPSQACNIARCEAAYRSFDPSDCTYQPSNGPRRLCTK